MVQQDDVLDEEIMQDEVLPEDNGTPFSDPDDMNKKIAPDDPSTDAEVELSERYQDGLPAAAEQDDGTDNQLEGGKKVG